MFFFFVLGLGGGVAIDADAPESHGVFTDFLKASRLVGAVGQRMERCPFA